MYRQEEEEHADLFITLFYRLAEHCNYHDLHDEMIRDQIVVGLQDSTLSESLQTDPELTLDKVVTMARRTKAVREHQAVVRGKTDNTFTRIEAVEHSYSNKKLRINCVPNHQDSKAANKKGCTRSSKFPTPPSAWLMKPHAVSVKRKATISQCVDQSQI